jgi:hypothetical protein
MMTATTKKMMLLSRIRPHRRHSSLRNFNNTLFLFLFRLTVEATELKSADEASDRIRGVQRVVPQV